MKHKATKLGPSQYEYRGFIIEKIEDAKHWNITWPGQKHADDAANTLADAKDMADLWLGLYR